MPKIHEECGVFGIYTNDLSDVAARAYYGLFALQHRGQESCGIVVNRDGLMYGHRGRGLVSEVFDEQTLAKLGQGNIAVGHVRYATTGTNDVHNIQPLTINHIKGHLAMAHNGNLSNTLTLRKELELNGSIFHTTSDTEVIAYQIIQKRLQSGSIEQAVAKAMDVLKGAYSLVLSSPRKLIAARDPLGFRPLCLGKIDGGYIVASESCALDAAGAKFIRDILPGEIIVINEDGLKSYTEHCHQGTKSLCVFEYIYFARPDSIIEGTAVTKARQKAGELLAQNNQIEADVVIGVPDSGLDAAIGYARQSGIPYGLGLLKNKYIGRTFIQPTQTMREDQVRIKLNAIKDTVNGKRVIMLDDSIVRGTTSARIVRLLREAGATEVHMRISAPPFLYPCYFGVDIDSQDKLIANKHTVAEIGELIGVDSLAYLEIDDLDHLAATYQAGYCKACFNGNYPVDVSEAGLKIDLEPLSAKNK